MVLASTFAIGLLFGLGILTSGMANPAKVLNFFDLAGTWDPSLAFVMAAALAVAHVGYRIVFARPAPVLADRFFLPSKNKLDARLLGGSAIFGVGWGMTGFCPGAAVPAIGTGRVDVLIFASAFFAGIIGTRLVLNHASNALSGRGPLRDGKPEALRIRDR